LYEGRIFLIAGFLLNIFLIIALPIAIVKTYLQKIEITAEVYFSQV